jgi:hypothetical protein
MVRSSKKGAIPERPLNAWAHAAHFCEDYRDFNGIKAPTRRRVVPILVADKPLPGPILVALDIHHIQPVLGSKAQIIRQPRI